jgi:dTDP-4-amino-4,6-dideoxygalactose transaminase
MPKSLPTNAVQTDSQMSPDAPIYSIPFLQTRLPHAEEYLPYLKQMDQNKWYSNFGPLVAQFEQEVLGAFFAGRGNACTVANCTLGLMIALRARARPEGCYVVLPSFTFAATALAVQWAGFKPFYVDIDPQDWTLDTTLVEKAVVELGDKLAAVMPYAAFGTALDLSFYQKLEDQGIPVVVDAAPGLGARNPDTTSFGSNFSGTIVFSMHATKPFGIGEGGLIFSSDSAAIETMRQLSNFGFSSPGQTTLSGLNAKLPEISAAIGIAALKTFPEKMQRLDKIFDAYNSAINGSEKLHGLVRTQALRGYTPHQFMPLVMSGNLSTSLLQSDLKQRGIEIRRYFNPPCHKQPILQTSPGACLNITEEIAERIICLPLWDGMTPDMPQSAINELAGAVAKQSRTK